MMGLEESLHVLAQEAEDFWLPSQIARISRPITPLEFLRDYVSPNIPVIFSQGCDLIGEWPALYAWQNWAHLVDRIGRETVVSVNATPDGRGDAVLQLEDTPELKVVGGNGSSSLMERGDRKEGKATSTRKVFIKPEERRMPFGEFVEALASSSTKLREDKHEKGSAVLYLSHQNDSLRQEFPMLSKDVDINGLDLANQAFGTPPDAVNLWIGDEKAISSLHKDPYENFYAVITGEKHFTLLPPCDVWALPEARDLPQAHYQSNPETHCFEVVLEKDAAPVTWVDVDIGPSFASSSCSSSSNEGHLAAAPRPPPPHTHPLECLVRPGEVLYLPSFWYHRVTQPCLTVAVNFWHDMKFDCKYVYWRFLRDITDQLHRRQGKEEEEEEKLPASDEG